VQYEVSGSQSKVELEGEAFDQEMVGKIAAQIIIPECALLLG
jgi:hypothetical protein